MSQDERPSRVIRSTPRLTREEIVNQSFGQAFRGLSEASVRAFLRRVADEHEAMRTRQDELYAELEQLERRVAQVPAAPPEQDLLTAVGEETARVLRSAKDAAEEIRRGAEERAAELLRDAHEEARVLLEQAEHAATERTRQADESAAEVLHEAERVARELQEGAEARVAEFETRAEVDARAEVESARRRSRELVAEAEATRDRMLSELARRRDALESQLELLRGGRERLLDAYKTVRRTLEEATDSLRSVDARPATEAPAPRLVSAALPPRHGEPDEAPEAPSPPATEEPRVELPESEPSPPSRVGSFQLGELEGPVVGTTEPQPPPAERPGPAPPLEKYRVEQPSGVRVLGTSQAPEPAPTPEPEAQSEPEPVDGAAPSEAEPRGGHESVDEIFARIRAQQASVPPSPPAEAPGATEQPAYDEAATEASAEPAREPAPPRPEADVQRRRDDALDPLVDEVVRGVKRVVRDEQNRVLESVRRHKGVPSADDVLPTVAEQDDAFAAATADYLNEACALGESVARGLGVSGGINGDGARRRARARELASSLARELMDPLRGKLGDALRDAAASDDESQVGERIRARYRDWKGPRIDAACRDALSGAFARGLYDAVPEGIPLKWVTTGASPCPDCADNVLEHTPRGRRFPTGHATPPAHPGCHCFVVPAEIAADLLSGV